MKIQVAADGIVGHQTAIFVNDKQVTDITDLRLTFAAGGLNMAEMVRLVEGARVEQSYYGGDAVFGLRDAALTVLRAWGEANMDREPGDPRFAPVALAMVGLASKVGALQTEMAQ